jgi:hypothetical protein
MNSVSRYEANFERIPIHFIHEPDMGPRANYAQAYGQRPCACSAKNGL